VLSNVALTDAIHIITGSGNLTISSTISDGLNAGAASKIQYKGSGILTLSGANSFVGGVEATGGLGTIRVQNSLALGAVGGTNSVGAGTTMEFSNNVSITGESLIVNGTGVGGNGALRNVSGANTFAGLVALSTDSTIKSESGVLSLSGASSLTLGGNVLTLDGVGDITVAGAITSTGTGSVTKTGTGTATFSAASTYTGATTVNAGTLLVTGSLAASSAITVNGGKFSAGSGVNLSNEVTVASGGRLGGNGTYSDTTGIVLGSGAIAAPGNSPGNTTYLTDLTLSSGAIYEWELGAYGTTAGTDSDLMTISGAGNILTFDSGSLLTLNFLSPVVDPSSAGTGNFWLSNHAWQVVDAVSGGSVVNNGLVIQAPSSFTNGSFALSLSGGDLYLNYTVVPEPSTWALLAFSMTTVMVLRRRRS